jgi:hypothetical protein
VRHAGAKDCWEIKDGVLQKDGHANDIASKEQFGDFELELEWKIGDASNSGVFYRGTDEFNQIYWSAPEYQLLDNVNAATTRRTTTSRVGLRPLRRSEGRRAAANDWNQTRIVAKGKHVEHWLNGKMVASYDVGSADWDAAIKAASSAPRSTRTSARRRRAISASRATTRHAGAAQHPAFRELQ